MRKIFQVLGSRHFSSGQLSAADLWMKYNQQGLAFLKNGLFNESEMVLRQAITIVNEIPAHDPNYTSTSRLRSTSLANLGSVYRKTAQYDKARLAFTDALGCLKSGIISSGSKTSPVDRAAVGRVQLELGSTYQELGDLQNALLCFEQANGLFEEGSMPQLQCKIGLARVSGMEAIERMKQDRVELKKIEDWTEADDAKWAKREAEAKARGEAPKARPAFSARPGAPAEYIPRSPRAILHAGTAYEEAIAALEKRDPQGKALCSLLWDAAVFYRAAAPLLDKHHELFHRAIEGYLTRFDVRFWEVVEDFTSSPDLEPATAKEFIEHYKPMV